MTIVQNFEIRSGTYHNTTVSFLPNSNLMMTRWWPLLLLLLVFTVH